MRFSLIVATKNRVEEVERFLRSVAAQDHQNFEVILADQNPDDRRVNLVKKYGKTFPLKHPKIVQPGTSRARNQGRLMADGDIIAYPDDDCLYPPGFLTQVAQFFQKDSTGDLE
ncbi:MAG: glycosyltransferase family A protein [Lyngbya sp.]|nr:glycosyltransferase family A protein [Lyngbya sp.]